jgi:hypothetical protein
VGAEAYAVLGRTPNAQDLNDAVVQGAAQHDPTLVPADARVLTIGAAGVVWLMPTNDGRLCLGVAPGSQYAAIESANHVGHLALGYVCADVATADASGVAVRIYNDIIGLVPDGVTTVSTALSGEQAQVVTVVNNVYSAAVPSGDPGFGVATFNTADGQRTTTPLP